MLLQIGYQCSPNFMSLESKRYLWNNLITKTKLVLNAKVKIKLYTSNLFYINSSNWKFESVKSIHKLYLQSIDIDSKAQFSITKEWYEQSLSSFWFLFHVITLSIST